MPLISEFLDGTVTTQKTKSGKFVTTVKGGFKDMTKAGYRSAIFQFLDGRFGNVRKKKDSTPEERAQYEELATEYFEGEVHPLEDLKTFKDYLTTIKRPPHSISQNIACVKIWLEHYDHTLNSKEIRDLKKYMPTQRAGVTREDEVTADTVRLILSHSGDVRLRAAILIMLSSGIRIGEMLQLNFNDIKMDKNTIYISDLISKSGEERITFFTDEAKEALQQYIEERKRIMERAVKRSSVIKKNYNMNQTEVFPITTAAIRKSLIRALKRAEIYRKDARTSRTTIHPHSFRKFFSSTLKMAGCPEDVVEELMGHRAGLASSYRRFGESQIRKKYEDFAHVLTIGDYGFEVRQELKARVDNQADKLLGLERENAELRAKIDNSNQTDEVAELKSKMSDLSALVESLLAAKTVEERPIIHGKKIVQLLKK